MPYHNRLYNISPCNLFWFMNFNQCWTRVRNTRYLFHYEIFSLMFSQHKGSHIKYYHEIRRHLTDVHILMFSLSLNSKSWSGEGHHISSGANIAIRVQHDITATDIHIKHSRDCPFTISKQDVDMWSGPLQRLWQEAVWRARLTHLTLHKMAAFLADDIFKCIFLMEMKIFWFKFH